MTAAVGLGLIGVASGTAGVVLLVGERGARLAVWISARHRSCYKVHADMPHAEWAEKIHEPVSARFLAERGYGRPTS